MSAQTKQFTPMLKNLMKLFVEKDLSLLEINPLVITSGGSLHCLDAKINIDANAIYRQPKLQICTILLRKIQEKQKLLKMI